MRDLGRKVKGQPWPLKLINSHCLIRFNISSENNDFGFNLIQKSTFQKISHLNALGSKFDLDAKKVRFNLVSSFEQTGKSHIPNATYQVPRSQAFWFWRRFRKGFYHIWAWRPYLSCDQNSLYKLWLPYHKSLHMKFEFNWAHGLWENCFNILMGPQYERPWLKGQRSVNHDLGNLLIAIVSLVLTYQVRKMTLALTVFKNISHLNALGSKGGRALRGKFGPLWSQKLKIAFHQFHPIGLLEEWPKFKILAFILLFSCYGNKNGRQNRLKIEKLSFWAKFKAFSDWFLKN